MSDRDPHDQGLTHDLSVLQKAIGRRTWLRWMAGASVLPILGCTSAGIGFLDGGGSDAGADGGATAITDCTDIPEETAGPYPGDGSNGPNVLTESGIVRSDIRPSFGAMTGTATGVLLNLDITVVNVKDGCAPLAGYAVYAWHCTADGKYSLYTDANENYLRGVQATDASGAVAFTSIFPGCYSGRMPHIHFEIYKDVATATAAGSKVATSQLAFPDASCKAVYATTGYEASIQNYANISFSTDMVFSDGVTHQLVTISGDAESGFTASLVVGVTV